MAKRPPFRHYEPRYHVKSFSHEKFWEVSVQTTGLRTTDVMTFFFDLYPMFGENWTSEGVETLIFFLSSPDVYGGKLDVRAPKHDFGGGHALPGFGPVCGHDDPQKTCPPFV